MILEMSLRNFLDRKVLIENYDRNSKQYVLGHQEICHIIAEELKQILEHIQETPNIKNKFPPRVVTSNYIFYIKDREIWYRENCRVTVFGIPMEPYDLDKLDLNNISNLKDLFYFFKTKFYTSKGKVSPRFARYLDYLLFPILYVLSFSSVTIRSMFETHTSVYYIILIWGDLLAIVSLPYFIYIFINKNKEIPIRYSYPFKNYFLPLNLSYLIIFFTFYELLIILGFLGYGTLQEGEDIMLFIFVLIIALGVGLYGSFSFIHRYFNMKKGKEDRLHNLYQLIQSFSIEQKIYLSQFVAKAEDSKIITTGILPKVIVLFTLLISIIPLF